MSNDIVVKVRNLSFSRGDRLIFDNISLDIPRGKITAVMGPSGTGKTTLLQLIGGQLKPSSGHIQVNEHIINQLSRRDLYKVRRDMSLLFQSGALLSDLNVYENVAFPLRAHTQLNESMIRQLVLMKLNAVGLRGARDLGTAQLSGGMARRVALARSLALDPQLIMYDEPFTGQDPISMGVLVRLIKRLHNALGMTSIIVSHDVPETASIADYIYLLAGGSVVGQGTPLELERSSSPYVDQFMHGLADGVVPFHYPAPDYALDLLEAQS
ncbi:MAG: ATP-binding cassette domain-containing protein [Gammaproteobacteria bacterium]|nr:ATP-binding cassette domain-containing protein [Gammaproteobacteria bacterium]